MVVAIWNVLQTARPRASSVTTSTRTEVRTKQRVVQSRKLRNLGYSVTRKLGVKVAGGDLANRDQGLLDTD